MGRGLRGCWGSYPALGGAALAAAPQDGAVGAQERDGNLQALPRHADPGLHGGGGRGVLALETPKVGEFTPKGVRGAGMSLVAEERKSELSTGDTQTE